ncbi:mediator of RNA polymerase II transcription [Colletotrichum tofieldiae]|nr:mediator of RNA polymerase II transcription [Colletotrichum tofieldiae]GKT73118.1 mediator of RNA polymerase II transcription [Colletotrichum tofieldiae]
MELFDEGHDVEEEGRSTMRRVAGTAGKGCMKEVDMPPLCAACYLGTEGEDVLQKGLKRVERADGGLSRARWDAGEARTGQLRRAPAHTSSSVRFCTNAGHIDARNFDIGVGKITYTDQSASYTRSLFIAFANPARLLFGLDASRDQTCAAPLLGKQRAPQASFIPHSIPSREVRQDDLVGLRHATGNALGADDPVQDPAAAAPSQPAPKPASSGSDPTAQRHTSDTSASVVRVSGAVQPNPVPIASTTNQAASHGFSETSKSWIRSGTITGDDQRGERKQQQPRTKPEYDQTSTLRRSGFASRVG